MGALEVLPPSLMTHPTQVGRMVGLGGGTCVCVTGMCNQ